MSLKDRILREWSFPVVNEADRPNRAAQNMKEIFDSNSNEIRDAINGVISDIEAGDSEQTFEEADARENIESGDTLAVILGKIKKWFNDLREAVTVIRTDEDPLKFLRGDGQYAIPQAGEAINGIPSNGRIKSVLFKRSSQDFDVAWGGPNDIGAAAQSFEAAATLLAANWIGNTYTLRLDGVTENNAIEMLPPESADITDEQLSALQEANIQDGGQSENILVFVARGKVPTIDLPVRFIIRGDLGDGTRGGYDGADILNENEIILQRHLPEGFPYDSTIWIRAEEQVSFANGEAEVYGDPLDHRITIGESYVVTWNGEEYNVECDASDLGLSRLRVDSLFSIVAMPRQFVLEGGAQLVLQDEIGLGTATFSIKRPGGEITKIDEKYLPDDIGGGDKVLNENGVIKQEHLPDGYPYENKTYVLPETQINNASNATLTIPENFLTEETVGTIYGVDWNGTPYTVECYKMDMGEGAYIYTLHEPNVFQLVSYASVSGKLYIEAQDGSTEATLSIYQGGAETIDEKYLPDSVKVLGKDGKVKTELLPEIPEDILSDKVLNSDGIIKQEHLPDGYPYKAQNFILEPITTSVANHDIEIYDKLAVGETYSVTWNGVVYECVAKYAKIMVSDTDTKVLEKPGVFIIQAFSPSFRSSYGAPACSISRQDGSTEANVSVWQGSIEKIAQEYLPDDIGGDKVLGDDGKIKTELISEDILGDKVLGSNGIIKQKFFPEGYPYKSQNFIVEPVTTTINTSGSPTSVGNNVYEKLTVGETYTVSWNGTEYDCVAHYPLLGDGTEYTMNLDLVQSGVFRLQAFAPVLTAGSGVHMMVTAQDGSKTVTLSVYQASLSKIAQEYLPDGYPYTVVEQTTVVDLHSPTLNETYGAYLIYETIPEMIEGNQYDVSYNGTSYSVTAIVAEGQGLIGNLSGIGLEDTGEPFIMVFPVGGGEGANSKFSAAVMDLSGNGINTMTVTGVAKVIKPLSERYLPELSSVTIMKVLIGMNANGDYTASYMGDGYESALISLMGGKPIQLWTYTSAALSTPTSVFTNYDFTDNQAFVFSKIVWISGAPMIPSITLMADGSINYAEKIVS